MSEHAPAVDGEQEWPTHCPTCGTELKSAVTGFEPGDTDQATQGAYGEVLAVDYCPNESCPSHQAAGEGDQPGADQPGPDPSGADRPGSLGGDNGGG